MNHKTSITFAAITLAAVALSGPASSMSATADADATCGGYAGPGLRWADTSYSGDASGAYTDVGASFSAHGSGTTSASDSDAGAWPFKLGASAGDSGGASVPDGTTIAAEGHASATGSLAGGNPPPADKADEDTCTPNTSSYTGSLGVLCKGSGQFELVGDGSVHKHQGLYYFTLDGGPTYRMRGTHLTNDASDYTLVQGPPHGSEHHEESNVNISPNSCSLTSVKVPIPAAN
jgi:hypothetical protein